jgi:hypothetical protein
VTSEIFDQWRVLVLPRRIRQPLFLLRVGFDIRAAKRVHVSWSHVRRTSYSSCVSPSQESEDRTVLYVRSRMAKEVIDFFHHALTYYRLDEGTLMYSSVPCSSKKIVRVSTS